MRHIFVVGLISIFVAGCVTTSARVLDSSDQSQLQKRSYQSRLFETDDKNRVMRGVISTMQDLSFVIERADLTLGTVSGTKIDKGMPLRLTVTAIPRSGRGTAVRANAQFNLKPVEDPSAYQDFFSSLEKSLFLTAQLGE